MPKPVQASIIGALRAQSLRHVVGAGRAHFQIALAYSIGLGVSADADHALSSLLESAKRGFLPAQAILHAWHTSQLRPLDVDEETQLDWLYNACIWGSVHATPILQRKSRLDYEAARKGFHDRGGYNQYFYDDQPPAHIGSSQFLEMLKLRAHQPSAKDMAALLQSAAIYGDTQLAQCILNIGNVDLNMCNQYGESLLVLCSKGGHIDLLRVSSCRSRCVQANH
jgi:TPR repeat protein